MLLVVALVELHSLCGNDCPTGAMRDKWLRLTADWFAVCVAQPHTQAALATAVAREHMLSFCLTMGKLHNNQFGSVKVLHIVQ